MLSVVQISHKRNFVPNVRGPLAANVTQITFRKLTVNVQLCPLTIFLVRINTTSKIRISAVEFPVIISCEIFSQTSIRNVPLPILLLTVIHKTVALCRPKHFASHRGTASEVPQPLQSRVATYFHVTFFAK
jgi:hypothetical protein